MVDSLMPEECKLNLDGGQKICRCCLSTGRRMLDAITYKQELWDLANLTVSQSDSLPSYICYECCMLLHKSVRFKQKVQRAHVLLYDYVTRCAPFSIDAQDMELQKYRTPQLSNTTTLEIDCTNGKSRSGFHKVLVHEKRPIKSELNDVVLPLLVEPTSSEGTRDAFVKEEDLFDYEDDIPLDEYKSNIESISEDALSLLLQDTENNAELKEESTENKKKRRPTRKKEKERKSRKARTNSTESLDKPKRSIRTPVDIDPTKIRIIDLNPEEHMQQLKEASMKNGLKLPYICQLCYKGFNFDCKLQNHMRKHSPSRGPYKCYLCHMHLPTKYSHGVHMLTHTRRYECLKCGRRMTDRASMATHYKAQHEGSAPAYTCHVCGKLSSNGKTHRSHVRNAHTDRAACTLCDSTFVNQDSLRQHMLIHRGIKAHVCPVCQSRFRTSTQLRLHSLTHSHVRDYYCVECDARFKTANSLRQHLKKSMRHKDKDSFKYPCETCGKQFETQARRDEHHAVQHARLRAHPCVLCGARLASAGSLAKHVRAHRLRRKPPRHVCHTCGRAFHGASVLANHARTHSGEKPFSCGRCGRRFTQRTAMHTHVKLVHLKVHRNAKIKPEILSGVDIPVEVETKSESPEMKAMADNKMAAEIKMAPEMKMADKSPSATLLVYDDSWRQQHVSDVYYTLAQDATRPD